MNPQLQSKILVPGSVLLDLYEASGEKFLGGACFNFAYHIHNLIGGVDFLSRIGADEAGRLIQAELARRAFPAHLIQVDPCKPTKTVQVRKDAHGEPIYIIASDVASEYLEFPPLSDEALAAYTLVYFGTTLQHGAQSRMILRQILDRSCGLKFCDINLRANKHTPETVEYSLRTCTCLKINHEELDVIGNRFGFAGDFKTQVKKLSEAFRIPVICLTLAEKGSLLYRAGEFCIKTPAPCSVVDTVGAGDGFSACLGVGLLHDWNSGRILDFASDFAAAVCGMRGAVPASADFYRPFRSRL